MAVPSWVYDAVFYQIFPDRFANGNLANDPPNVRPWGSKPDVSHFMGGDLEGIRQNLDYLSELGVNAIYLNPIFLSPSTHRYNTVDYYRVDPKLGSNEDFERLLDEAHRREMRLILDGVFNHCSRGFFAFNDVLENGRESPYQDWFHIHKFPLAAYSRGPARNYDAWWNFKPMPKFNTDTPAVRNYLLGIAKYWIDFGADGWRLDVPNEIDDDHFWADFRSVVHSANPEAYTVGEIWEVDPRWANDQHFDGLMNYPLRTAILDLLNGNIGAAEFSGRVSHFLGVYPRENAYAMFNLLGSHDTERIKTMLGGDPRKTGLAFSLLMALPGVPCVYYGDEIGLEGGKDPDCRGAFLWDEQDWDQDFRWKIRKLIAVRKNAAALHKGDCIVHPLESTPGGLAILRLEAGEGILALANCTESEADLSFPLMGTGVQGLENGIDLLEGSLRAALTDEVITARLPAWSCAYFQVSAATN